MLSRMNALFRFLKKERDYLRELSPDQRRLLFSTFLFGLAQPMITVFSNTFLWRQSGDGIVLAVFGIGQYIGLSIGFLANGFFLKRIRPTTMFLFGCILQGAVPVLLVFMGARAEELAFPLGLSLGLSSGLYWGNRNLLTSVFTQGETRFKYISVEMTFGLLSSVIAPAAIGWFLVFGEQTGWYATDAAYQVTAMIGFALMTIGGIRVAGVRRAFERIEGLFIARASRSWNRMRLLDFVNGFTDGFERVIPLLILLLFLGKEDSVGFVQSGAAVLSMVGMYLAGKRVKHKDHARIVGVWTAVTSVGKTIFALGFSAAAALAFHALNGLVMSFRWASLAAVMYEAVDREPGDGLSKRYRYLMDREFFLNTGRVSGLLLFIGLYAASATFTIRYGLVFAILLQIVMILGVRAVTRLVPHERVDLPASEV